jgi:hypothetical protein
MVPINWELEQDPYETVTFIQRTYCTFCSWSVFICRHANNGTNIWNTWNNRAHYIFVRVNKYKPVSIAERSKSCTVYDRLNIEIACSNPARGMDVCLRVSVLCCPVFR